MSTKVKDQEIAAAMESIRNGLTKLDMFSNDPKVAWCVENLMDVLAALELIGFASQPPKSEHGWGYQDDGDDREC